MGLSTLWRESSSVAEPGSGREAVAGPAGVRSWVGIAGAVCSWRAFAVGA
jgi:hypothetical protein